MRRGDGVDSREVVPAGRMRISGLAARADVTTHALRVWERRYGLFDPARTEAGYRLYDSHDLHRLLVFRRLVDDGRRAGDAARLALSKVPIAEDGEPVAVVWRGACEPEVPDLSAGADELNTALTMLDERRARTALTRLTHSLTVEIVLAEIVIPVVQRLGVDWIEGRLPVSRGQFAFNLLRHEVVRLGGPAQPDAAGVVWLACPPREAHDLVLLVAAALLRRLKWQVVYFGANTPLCDLTDAARSRPPDVVLLSAQRSVVLHAARASLSELTAACPVALAGHGVRRELTESVGASRLRGGITSALAELDMYRKG